MAADLASHAFGHALAVLGDPREAAKVAGAALARGSRSLTSILAHARHLALEAAPASTGSGPDPAPTDVTALAGALAATRPGVERAIVDLETRHGLDRAGLAQVLGLEPAAAARRATTVRATWEAALDPALLVRLGPGSCERLAELLAEGGLWHVSPADEPDAPPAAPSVRPEASATVAQLLEIAPVVVRHASGCALCGDRLRAMVSVRDVLAQRPLEAPSLEVLASNRSRFRRPAPLPPSLEPRRRRPRLSAPASVAAATVAVALGVFFARTDSKPSAVEALTRLPPGGTALRASPDSIGETDSRTVTLANHSDGAIAWSATSEASWLTVEPARAVLEARATTAVRLNIGEAAPEGFLRTSVSFVGNDGSTTAVRVAALRERAPGVDAQMKGCRVTSTVEDEVDLVGVSLNWTDAAGANRTSRLRLSSGRWIGDLPVSPSPVSWFVSAVDARGNEGRTPTNAVPPGTC